MKRVSVVIPAFNEEKDIAIVINIAKKCEYVEEIIVVDNLSTDKTEEIALKEGAKIVKCHNQGKGYAMEDGMKEVAYHQVDGFSIGEGTDLKFRNLSAQSEENGSGKEQSENNVPDVSIMPNTDYMFGASIEISDEDISISGGAGISAWLEMNIDINHGEIVCSMALKSEGGADISVDFAESLLDLPEPPSIEKTI